jgi:hypothetical protein
MALRTLVAGVVDYAGLFPPAALEMSTAVANYASYRASDDAWMLGRFVVPVARLDEWTAAVGAVSAGGQHTLDGGRVSALLSGEFSREAELIAAFNRASPHGVCIDVAEGRASTPDAVLAMAAAMPDDVMLYCELPHRHDPLALLQAVKSAGVRAKLRAGGVTPDAFPSAADIVRFLRRSFEMGVTAKATAGLHHPLRGEYRLTYAPDAARGVMYGYLNVFLAMGAIRIGADDDMSTSVLLEQRSSSFVMRDDAVVYAPDGVETLTLLLPTLSALRETGLVAFGSCSFREPVEELCEFLVPGAA